MTFIFLLFRLRPLLRLFVYYISIISCNCIPFNSIQLSKLSLAYQRLFTVYPPPSILGMPLMDTIISTLYNETPSCPQPWFSCAEKFPLVIIMCGFSTGLCGPYCYQITINVYISNVLIMSSSSM